MYNNREGSDVLIGIIENLDMNKIKPSRLKNTRNVWDEEVACLARSIKQRGLLQPIIVRIVREQTTHDDNFEIVAGNRRYLACRSLGLRKILAHVVELDEKGAFEISLVENIERKTLQPIEEARAFETYIKHYGWGGISDLALKIGRSPSYVFRRVRLLDFPEEILHNISNNNLNASTAEELVTLRDSRKRDELARLALKNSWSSRKVRQAARQLKEESVYDREGLFDQVSIRESKVSEIDERTQRAFNKSIISLRLAMKRIADIMESVEDNWIIYELLLQHRNMLHSQIDLMIKQMSKL